VRHRSLNHRRGDVAVTVDSDEQFVTVSGGDTHTNRFCTPLRSVERYDLDNNDWEEIAPLQQGRSGLAVVELQDQLVVLGGEQQIRKTCQASFGDPSDLQTPVYGVEAYKNGVWQIFDTMSDYRFRSTSVVYKDKVYSFGGQSVYFGICKCHPTVDDVIVYSLGSGDLVEAGDLASDLTGGAEWNDFSEGEATSVVEEEQYSDFENESPTLVNEGEPETEAQFSTGGYNRDQINAVQGSSGAPACPKGFLFTAGVGLLATLFL
jgi:hypothetical protein